jgi:hypothetical protein
MLNEVVIRGKLPFPVRWANFNMDKKGECGIRRVSVVAVYAQHLQAVLEGG